MLSRRATLIGATASLVGCSPDGSRPAGQRCVPASSLARTSSIAGAALPYEIDGVARTYVVDEAFLAQLDGWLTGWNSLSATARVTEITTYGLWTEGDCTSMHNAGRALDIARLRADGSDLVSCRHDRWRSPTSDDPTAASVTERSLQRQYWRLAASLHASFAHVLTYLYDDLHDNHIHIDDAVSSGRPTVFNPSSRTQTQSVAAMATWVHGVVTRPTGAWDAGTQSGVGTVLNRLGISGTLTDRQVWQTFLAATARG